MQEGIFEKGFESFPTFASTSGDVQVRTSREQNRTGKRVGRDPQALRRMVESIPEADYPLPTDNPAWTVGDILYHITLGPRALALETWMTVHTPRLYNFMMRHFPSGFFNRVHAWFGRGQGKRVSRQGLLKACGKAHTAIKSSLRRTREEDLGKTTVYPLDYVSDLRAKSALSGFSAM